MQQLNGNITNNRYSANVMRAQLDQLKARSQSAITDIQTINGQSIEGEGDLTLQEFFGTDLYKKFDDTVNNRLVSQRPCDVDRNPIVQLLNLVLDRVADSDKNSIKADILKAVSDIRGVDAKNLSDLYSRLTALLGDYEDGGTVKTDLAATLQALQGNDASKNLTKISEEISVLSSNTAANSTRIEQAISALKQHINTINPPTLTATHNGASVYDITDTPTLTVTASVNRPLEETLQLCIDGNAPTVDESAPRTWTYNWTPSYESGAKLPYKTSITVCIVDKQDSTVVYTEKDLTCTFGANIYYWVESDSFITTNQKLTVGHPGTINFICDGAQYCYYACPQDYGVPTFTAGGFPGGFSKVGSESYNGIQYQIYRSEQKLNTISVTIK